MIQADLRPLGAGEILDRSVTLFVRFFWPLALILALFVVPLSVVSYFTESDSMAKMLGDFQRYLAIPPGHPAQQRAVLEEINRSNHFGVSSWLSIALALLLAPLITTACAIVVDRRYRGVFITAADAFREAARRWIAQIVTDIIYIVLYVALVAAVVIGTLVTAAISIAIFAISHVVGLIVGIPLGLLLFAGCVGALVLLFLAWQLAYVCISIEDAHPGRAVGRSLRRTFGRATFWRSLLTALIFFTIFFVGSLVVESAGGLLGIMTHVKAIGTIAEAIGSIVLNALIVCYLVVYSYDVRVRREGYDLALASQAPL